MISTLSPEALSALFEKLQRGREVPEEAPLAPRPRPQEGCPLSYAQERLWFVNQLDPTSSAYNVSMAIRIEGMLDQTALGAALDLLEERHESLRTAFPWTDQTPLQKVLEPGSRIFCRIDLQGLEGAARQRAMEVGVHAESERPFDLAQGALFRSVLLQMGPSSQVLLLVLHHIVSDGLSMRILVDELVEAYGAYLEGEEPELPELPIQYADFAIWQREHVASGALEEQLEFWRRQLEGAPELIDLATDFPRPEVENQAAGGTEGRLLPTALLGRTKDLAREHGTTLFVVLSAGFSVLLHHHTGARDLVFGSNAANRNRVELEGVIGFFINQVALRVRLEEDPTFSELVDRVRDVALGAFDHQDIPFGKVVEALCPDRRSDYSPIVQVKIEVQERDARDVEDSGPEGLGMELLDPGLAPAHQDLHLLLEETEEGLDAELQYRRDLFEAKSAARMVEQFEEILTQATGQPEIRLSDLVRSLAEQEAARLREARASISKKSGFGLKGIRRRSVRVPREN